MATAGTWPSSEGYSQDNARFNEQAAAWDSNPYIHAMTDQAFLALREHVPCLSTQSAGSDVHKSAKPDVLELGCGTGLLTLKTAELANVVVAVDAAPAMISVLQGKLATSGSPQNVIALAILLEDAQDRQLPPASKAIPAGPRLQFDLITSHLVLHHIPSLPSVLNTMFACLKPGGMVALTDFEDFGPEAKRFHPRSKMAGVERHGIQRHQMEHLMREAGFDDVRVSVAWRYLKRVEAFPGQFEQDPDARGEQMEFSYVICLGTKPS